MICTFGEVENLKNKEKHRCSAEHLFSVLWYLMVFVVHNLLMAWFEQNSMFWVFYINCASSNPFDNDGQVACYVILIWLLCIILEAFLWINQVFGWWKPFVFLYCDILFLFWCGNRLMIRCVVICLNHFRSCIFQLFSIFKRSKSSSLFL